MQLFVKQYTGHTITLHVFGSDNVSDVFFEAYKKRSGTCVATPENWAKAVSLVWSGKKLEMSKSLSECGLGAGATVHEVLKSWTMTHGFDFKTLCVTDAAEMEEIV
mgnify:CR=1 FL=1